MKTGIKYGLTFGACSALLILIAVRNGGWFLVLLWPAFSIGLVAISYARSNPKLFGKRPDGIRSVISTIALLPFLTILWITWHLTIRLSSENAFDALNDEVLLSRRLLDSELPSEIGSIVDLTCEFSERRSVRLAADYRCYPILDATACTSNELHTIASTIDELPKPVLVHCAQGHGRTGLVTCAWLIHSGKAQSIADALNMVQSVRPEVGLNHSQQSALEHFHEETDR